MKILITGCAGFIGAALTEKLLEKDIEIVGIDDLNDYYDVALKHARLKRFDTHPHFYFYKKNIADLQSLEQISQDHEPSHIIHLAAQPGVNYSTENPQIYVQSNLVGFANILQIARLNKIAHLIFASSSAVYGQQTELPFKPDTPINKPTSFFAATKAANELLAYSYSNLYQIPITGLRYFSVYGPWGRPDMVPIKFAENIMRGETIDVYNYGHHRRDFTYIDDAVNATIRILEQPKFSTEVPYKIYNIARSQPIELLKLIELLETALGKQAIKEFLPEQPGDIKETWGDMSAFEQDYQLKLETDIDTGIVRFAEWFKQYFQLQG